LQAGPDVLRLVPPLNITDAEIAAGLERLQAVLRAFRR
jgi:acetylornithine/N-succinyldiaminopimelate aminotransferase